MVLGIDPVAEPEFVYIAKEALKAPLPSNWKPMYVTVHKHTYMHVHVHTSCMYMYIRHAWSCLCRHSLLFLCGLNFQQQWAKA